MELNIQEIKMVHEEGGEVGMLNSIVTVRMQIEQNTCETKLKLPLF